MNSEWLIVFLAYLIGSVPFGLWITKLVYGFDIRTKGSGNIGSTNVGRFTSKSFALWIQILDMLKGLVPVALILYRFDIHHVLVYRVAFATVVGHCFSIFLLFKGGKGVNTSIGALVCILPISVAIGIGVYFLVKKFSHFVSMSSMSMSISWILSSLIVVQDPKQIIFTSALCMVVVIRHRKNIIRLMKGEEPKTNIESHQIG
ncbi:glycerol-3-phosphate 1-O-acyltransferase PlsY [Halosquirtibacter laminarini]|uniref:Glycerol-3-phosphate 1-O-acyltransferase PlsY n=1 Tax=Halosquirtibacter laminarini TaxID=3374600 RepID=A0AC61NB90_9BACT|nr:glycerol-3-phosphate 1-O-acyltransferase PlsY [Prolixibacteraceae bacterium]